MEDAKHQKLFDKLKATITDSQLTKDRVEQFTRSFGVEFDEIRNIAELQAKTYFNVEDFSRVVGEFAVHTCTTKAEQTKNLHKSLQPFKQNNQINIKQMERCLEIFADSISDVVTSGKQETFITEPQEEDKSKNKKLMFDGNIQQLLKDCNIDTNQDRIDIELFSNQVLKK